MEYKGLIQKLGFVPKDNASDIFVKKYSNCEDYCIEVDFNKQKFFFGERLVFENRTTQNFAQAENWVILECVNRLLEKGYKPQNIVLEKTWATGHGTSGRLDILVTRDDGSAYMMIECKTNGAEFEKEYKRILKDGGQLFTYFQQDKNADILMLYASNLDKKAGVQYRNEITKIEDDYRQTGNVKDFYDRWNKLPKNNGVFDDWVKPYDFQSRALTPKSLKEIKQEDSSFIFNRFLEILRHNVVSDKPNAFNKIFTLFLCKIYDEKSTRVTQELKFQWLEGVDTNISFQKRLADLYKKGMKEFLEKEVSDLSDREFEEKFGLHILDEQTKRSILEQFTELRLKKNNEFAIKEVFDDASFEDNAKVVKEVVELLQGYKIRYTKRHQYLSDFFELLLTTGLKQESGQFFTPVPIAQFIIKSIPLDKIVLEKLSVGEADSLLPAIIDYAAGSGHFLTESMHEVQRILNSEETDGYIEKTAIQIKKWQLDHFDWATQYVYGIEKDYRLVKVGKVGCYLHGDGLAKVIHGDGLANFTHTKEYQGKLKNRDKFFPQDNKQFDIVISNPPYSVSAFKGTLKNVENDFDLYNELTDQSSQIECLFIERTKQLLKDGGVAGIILPSSILNNGGIYTKSREIILQYFDVVGIAELGSNTFMATGTNTVTLFLRRRKNEISKNIRVLSNRFSTSFQDVNINGIEKPVSKYLAHVWDGVTLSDYITLMQKQPNDVVQSHEIYKEYQKKITAKTSADKWVSIIEREQDKLFYFIISYAQKVVLVKSGEKDIEKQFLGYEFSNRRGSEGIHPIQRGKSIDECTSLFDPDIFDNPEKASTYIYKAFQGDYDFPISNEMAKFVSRHSLVDMLSFDKVDFDKSISLSVKKKVDYKSVWGIENIVSLGEISEIKKGTTITKEKAINGIVPVIAGGKEPAYYHNQANRSGQIITVSASGANSGFVNFFDIPIYASDCNTIKSLDEGRISTRLIYNFLSLIQEEIYSLQRGQAQPHVYSEDLEAIKIPSLPIGTQRKIERDFEEIEKLRSEAKKQEAILVESLNEMVMDLPFEKVRLSEIAGFKNGLNYSRKSIGDEINIVGVKDFQTNFEPDLESLERVQIEGKLSDEYLLSPGDILVVRSNGSANLVGRFLYINSLKGNTSFSGFTIRLRTISSLVRSKYLFYYLRSDLVRETLTGSSKGANIKSLNQALLSSVEVPLPPMDEQDKIVAMIETAQNRILDLKSDFASLNSRKLDLLKKYID